MDPLADVGHSVTTTISRKTRHEDKGRYNYLPVIHHGTQRTPWSNKAKSFDLKQLTLKQLHPLVRALGVGKGTGSKPDTVKLLEDKFGGITKQQFEALCVKVNRGVARTSVATVPPALPQPPVQHLQPPQPTTIPAATTVDTSAPLALRRPRRG